MANKLVDYKGLKVPANTFGDGGRAIKDNFKTLADWVSAGVGGVKEIAFQAGGSVEHDGCATVLLTVNGDLTADTTTPIEAGRADGQRVLIQIDSISGSFTLRNQGNVSLRGDWATGTIGTAIELEWYDSVWQEVYRSDVGNPEGMDSHAHGPGAYATQPGQRAHASGTFAAAGDAQDTQLIARKAFTEASEPEFHTLDEPAASFVIEPNKSYAFLVKIIGRIQGGKSGDDSGSRCWLFYVLVEDTGGTPEIVAGGSSGDVIADRQSGNRTDGWDARFAISGSNLQVQVKAEADQAVRFAATIQPLEIEYASM